jgi:catechol 2,3-dioxygenase-like lactoylglutathione lyase family enzyme
MLMNNEFRAGVLLLGFFSMPALAVPEPAPMTATAETQPSLIGAALRSTDLDRSIKYYTTGLGMVVARKINMGAVTEVFLAFEGKLGQPGLIIFRDETPGKSPPVDHGNAASRVVLRMPDVAATATRLIAAGYMAGEIHSNGNVKVLNIKDPDGYAFELAQVPTGEVKLRDSTTP